MSQSVNIKAGSTVKLDVIFPGGGAGLFPQAILLDQDNAPITGSPLNLVSVAGDLYSGTFTFPVSGTTKVTAETIAYTDAGHTTPDTNFEQALDEFFIQNDITAGQAVGNNAVGTIQGTLKDETNLTGVLQDDNIIGVIGE